MRHTRPEVITRTRREFARLDRVVRRLGAADWKRRVPRPPTRDPWTVKDALCHIRALYGLTWTGDEPLLATWVITETPIDMPRR